VTVRRHVGSRIVWVTCAAAASYVVLFRLTDGAASTRGAHDLYAYYYPNMLHALAALRAGARGLLWNPYQNCGQPFFGIIQTGLLYPLNLLYLLFRPHVAMRALQIANLTLAGVFAWALCRELGVGPRAALAGALTFELGNGALHLASWTPNMLAPYAWLPAALLWCERLLRAPTIRGALGLGAVLAMGLLAAYPQTVFFAYQLIAFRVIWALVGRKAARPIGTMAAVAVGGVLAPLLCAVQLMPALEVARESVRNAALTVNEMAPQGQLDWQSFLHALAWRDSVHTPFVLVPCVVAAAALLAGRTRHVGLFYTVAGTLYLLLAFGTNTRLFRIYMTLPLGTLFRQPERSLWITSLCLAVLTALGIEAIAASGEPARPSRRWGVIVAPVAALVAFRLLTPLQPREAVLISFAIAACIVAGLAPRLGTWAAAFLVGCLVVNLIWMPSNAWMRFFPDDTPLFVHRDVFERLRSRMTAQDRVHVIYGPLVAGRFALMPKDASVFHVPSIQDYEPETAQRWASYFVMMGSGKVMTSTNDLSYMAVSRPVARRLYDLSAARYLVVQADLASRLALMQPPPRLLEDDGDVRVLENERAFPRARWIPRIAIVPDPPALLGRLVRGSDDLGTVALVETALPSNFTGAVDERRAGEVTFVRDEPEHITLRVRAPARGFVLLADEYYPGWEVTVNGTRQPIARADYAFRLVEVPAGDSTLEFRYVPRALLAGAMVSTAAICGVAAMLYRTRRSRA
jgi:membrane protein YfhO